MSDETTLEHARRKVTVSLAGTFGELYALDGVPDPRQSRTDETFAWKDCMRIQVRFPGTDAMDEMTRARLVAGEILKRPKCGKALVAL
ncbi:MAG: hypothetical protein ACYDAR_16535, partial [Thermomicrobiales bacterium]